MESESVLASVERQAQAQAPQDSVGPVSGMSSKSLTSHFTVMTVR